MIFGGRKGDTDYTPWFAWRPVRLRGPYEWARMKTRGCDARLVWLQTILRWRVRPSPYYALPEEMQ